MERTADCHGGPLDGQRVTALRDKGIVVVNRPKRQVVIYDFNGISFVARNGGVPEPELTTGPKNRYRAALENKYHVVAYNSQMVEEWGPWGR